MAQDAYDRRATETSPKCQIYLELFSKAFSKLGRIHIVMTRADVETKWLRSRGTPVDSRISVCLPSARCVNIQPGKCTFYGESTTSHFQDVGSHSHYLYLSAYVDTKLLV
jgi:hypothetical protein